MFAIFTFFYDKNSKLPVPIEGLPQKVKIFVHNNSQVLSTLFVARTQVPRLVSLSLSLSPSTNVSRHRCEVNRIWPPPSRLTLLIWSFFLNSRLPIIWA